VDNRLAKFPPLLGLGGVALSQGLFLPCVERRFFVSDERKTMKQKLFVQDGTSPDNAKWASSGATARTRAEKTLTDQKYGRSVQGTVVTGQLSATYYSR